MLLNSEERKNLSKLEDETNTYIQVDSWRCKLTVYGTDTAINKVLIQINRLLENAKQHGAVHSVRLSGDRIPRGLLKKLLRVYGFTLEELITQTHATAIKVNVKKHELEITGTKEAFTKVSQAVADVISEMEKEPAASTPTDDDDTDGETCPVCFMEVDPGEESYRLQICGHLHCQECLLMQLQSKQLPLVCSLEDCNQLFSLEDLKFFIASRKTLHNDLLNVALKKFVEKNSQFVSHCPTPDCAGIFRIKNEDTEYECTICNNVLCCKCKVVYHFGMSCEFYQKCKEDEDYSLKSWMNEDTSVRKPCPKCKVPIEKSEGCHHMTCTNCEAHMCWKCMKVFRSASLVYSHQPFCKENTTS